MVGRFCSSAGTRFGGEWSEWTLSSERDTRGQDSEGLLLCAVRGLPGLCPVDRVAGVGLDTPQSTERPCGVSRWDPELRGGSEVLGCGVAIPCGRSCVTIRAERGGKAAFPLLSSVRRCVGPACEDSFPRNCHAFHPGALSGRFLIPSASD